MTLTTFVFALFILTTGYFIVSGLIDLRASRRLREIIRRQKTQREFGKLRHNLMLRLTNQEINSRSLIFLHLYLLDTTIMRRPEKHKPLADKLREIFAKGPDKADPVFTALIDERPNWSPETHGLVAQHSVELTLLMLRYSTVLRIVHLCAKLIGRALSRNIQPRIYECAARIAGTFNPTTRAIAHARDNLAELAAA